MINGQYTPLNLNCLGQLLQDIGLTINPAQQILMGVSTSDTTYTTKGTIYTDTLLSRLSEITVLAYNKIGTASPTTITQSTYNALISMGSTTIPALGNSKPSTYTRTYTGEMTKYGWLRLIARQANEEFYVNGSTSYSDFVNTFISCDGYTKTVNSLIKSYGVANNHLKTSFSNMSDLITSDITGVSLSTLYWGQDLIASGRAIDLTRISDFGLPSVLLKTLVTNHALTASFSLALRIVEQDDPANFIVNDIIDMAIKDEPLTINQEKLLYRAFIAIFNDDLKDICTLLNCQTPNLGTLADLLDPKKLFPNSYTTLTYPKYNSDLTLPTNSRTYYRIYLNNSPDTGITPTLGKRLSGILPSGVDCAADAFSISMMQIKNIQSMNIEKFAQVVTNLENVVGSDVGAASSAIDPYIANDALAIIAKGSGTNNEYTTCDFFGAITNLHYDFNLLKNYINALPTAPLVTVYEQMYALMSGAGPYESDLLDLIDDANTIIIGLLSSSSEVAALLNTVYNKFGEYLTKEQNARDEALPNIADLTTSTRDLYSFIDNLNNFAVQTQDKGPSLVLESIADTTTVGGNSLIGSMREIRNSVRLGLVGGKIESGVDTSVNPLPRITGTTARQNPIAGFTPSNCAGDTPIITGAAKTPGSFAGSPEVRLIPPNLSVFNTGLACSVLTPKQAVDQVIKCNCTCWDNLQ